MQKLKYGFTVIFLLIVGGLVRFEQIKQIEQSNRDSEIAISDRGPASVAPTNPRAIESQIEIYEFSRRIQATLQTVQEKKNFAGIAYRGKFYVEWFGEKNSQAKISFQLDDGKGSPVTSPIKSTIQFEIKMNEWMLVSMNAGESKSEVDEDHLNILKDFSSIFAYRSNSDTSGRYAARIRAVNPALLVKEKIRYVSPKVGAQIKKSFHQIRLKPGTLKLESAEGDEITSVNMGQSSHLLTHSEYEIKHIGNSNAPSKPNSQISIRKLVPVSMSLSPAKPFLTVPWPKTFARLNALKTLNPDERIQLFHELVRALKVEKNAFSQFKDWVKSHYLSENLRTFAIGVLATLGGVDAQKTLINLFQTIPEARTIILNALTTSEAKLSAEAFNFIKPLLNQKSDPAIAYGSAFALGASLRTGSADSNSDFETLSSPKKSASNRTEAQAETQAETQRDIIDQLRSLLHSSASTQETETYLDAIGNSGNGAFLPDITQKLSSPEETIREKAVLAFRFMNEELTESFVRKGWNDSSLRVKAAVIQVIGIQKSSSRFQDIIESCKRTAELANVCQSL